MRKTLLIISMALTTYMSQACTNFLVGKKASADGNIMISYAADSYAMAGFLSYMPAANHQAGDLRKIYDWDTGTYLGAIPEAPHTYSVVGNMNEHQLVIGETTFGGRTELMDTMGMIDYGSLIYVTLQRCRTAREAVRCMADLVASYGYYSEGESFSIADTKEVWIMEMVGKAGKSKGAVWVATRIPDDCISAHANQARITTINFKDTNNWMWAEDVVDFAREQGYYDGDDEHFSFSDTYAPLDFSGLYICEARVWSFFRHFSSEIDTFYSYVMGKSKERMPLYIRPNKKVTLDDMRRCMRDHYDGTPLDITQGTDAGPWHSKLRYGSLGFKIDSVQYWYERPTATQQTAWSFIAQIRPNVPDHVGGILWFGLDDAATNLYVPMYAHMNAIPWCYDEKNGDLVTYSSTSAFWTFNKVANFAYSKYSAMLPEIQTIQSEWEQYFDQMIPAIDAAAMPMNPTDAQRFLTQFSMEQAQASTQAWDKLWEYLLVKYIDGQEKKTDSKRQFLRTKTGAAEYPNRPSCPESYLRTIMNEVEHE